MSAPVRRPPRRRPTTSSGCATSTLDWFEALPLGHRASAPRRPGDDRRLHRLDASTGWRCCRWCEHFAAAKAALPAVDFADQMTLAAQLAAAARGRRGRARPLRAPCCSTSTRTPGHAQVEMLRGLFGAGPPGHRGRRPVPVDLRLARRERRQHRPVRRDLPRTPTARPPTVFPLATSFRNDRGDPRRGQRGRRRRCAPEPAHGRAAPARRRPARARSRVARTETVEDEARWVARPAARGVGRAAGRRPHRRRARPPALRRSRCSPTRCTAPGCRSRSSAWAACSTTPEVVDVVATLRVLVRPRRRTAPWRGCSPARAGASGRATSPRCATARATGCARPASAGDVRRQRLPPTSASRSASSRRSTTSGRADAYSPEGYRRTARGWPTSCAGCAGGSPRRCPSWSPRSSAAIGVDIEVAARADRARVGRVHLDRFLDEAADFAAEADEATPARVPRLPRGGRGRGERPRGRRGRGRRRAGAGADRARRQGPGVGRRRRARAWSTTCSRPRPTVDQLDARAAGAARRRCAATATTCRRSTSPAPPTARRCATGSTRTTTRSSTGTRRRSAGWPTSRSPGRGRCCSRPATSGTPRTKPRDAVAVLLDAARARAEPTSGSSRSRTRPTRCTAEARGGAVAARPARARTAATAGRAGAPAVEAGAGAGARGGAGRRPACRSGRRRRPARRASGAHDVDRLLAERARLRRGRRRSTSSCRAQLSVSQLVELRPRPGRAGPRASAARCRAAGAVGPPRHGVPHLARAALAGADPARPRRAARRRRRDGADDADFDELRAAFERSEWASRTPAEVEVPFEMAVDGPGGPRPHGRRVRHAPPTAGWSSTGRPAPARPAPRRGGRGAAGRLPAGLGAAAAASPTTSWHRVRAAFHYVRSDETVEPVDLLDAAGLRALVTGGAAAAS